LPHWLRRASTRYGALAEEREESTGRFRIAKLGDRWWMINPEGGRFVFHSPPSRGRYYRICR
jgi:hypothetical protein